MKKKYFSWFSTIVLTLMSSFLLHAESCLICSGVPLAPADLSELTGRVVVPGDVDYNAARLSWNTYFSRYPLAVVYVQNKQDILNALNFCCKNRTAFRIRSGGHGLEGWSSLDGGIMIDLSDMNAIRVEKNLAYVQPGVKQLQAVTALGALGLAIPTGLEQTPGIAGVTLGGGIGLSIREYGLACDHLVEVEVILASGKIVRASKHNHEKLFYACQGGGGGNFGVVTEFVYKVYPRGDVTLFKIEFPYSSIVQMIDTWQRWAPFQTKRLNSFMELFASGNPDINGIYSGPQSELMPLLAPILAIPGSSIVNVQTLPYVDSWLYFAADVSPPANDKFSSTFVYEFLPLDAINEIKNALDNPVNSRANFWFLAMGGVMKKIPKNATPFWNRDALFYFEWDQSWADANPQEAGPAFTWVENIRTALNPYIKGSYVNVPDMDMKNWGHQYYGKNFRKLKKIKKHYDPNNFFTYEIQAIPLK